MSSLAEKFNDCKLRKWQADAVDKVEEKYEKSKLAVVEACTGAGKTTLGNYTSAQRVLDGLADLVIVLCPSICVKQGWVKTAEKHFGFTASAENNFREDTNFWAVTYSGHKAVINALADRRKKGIFSKVFLIVDEYHHAERDAEWGLSVDTLSKMAVNILMLSGTPWRSTGQIALLAEHGYYKDGYVVPDYAYTYAQDLSSDTRGTLPVFFTAVESTVTEYSEGEAVNCVSFLAPEDDVEKKKMIEEETENPCQLPLGPHVAIKNADLRTNAMARKMLSIGHAKLQESKQAYNGSAIMLVVARSIKEARCIATYLEVLHACKVAVIVSDETANTSVDEIQKEIDRNGPNIPDVIVSVGMVSEGVDIPLIKVVVYLSAILTALYLIQVLGRALRRVRLNEQYVDPDDTLDMRYAAHFIHPAHPFLIKLAASIEEEVAKAKLKEKKPSTPRDGDPPVEKEESEYLIDAGDISNTYRGTVIPSIYYGWIEALVSNSEVRRDFKEIFSFKNMLIEFYRQNPEYAQENITNLASKYKIDLSMTPAYEEELTYDQKVKLIKDDATRLTSQIRFSHPTFKNIDDDQIAFAKVRAKINKLAKISSFTTASLEQMENWVAKAQEMLSRVKDAA